LFDESSVSCCHVFLKMFVIALLSICCAAASHGFTSQTSREEAPRTSCNEDSKPQQLLACVPSSRSCRDLELMQSQSDSQVGLSSPFKALAVLLLALNFAAGFRVTRHDFNFAARNPSGRHIGRLSVPRRCSPRAFETLTSEDWVERLAEAGADDRGGDAASYLNTVLATAPEELPATQAIALLELMEQGGRLPLPDTVSYACAAAAAMDAGMDTEARAILDRAVQRHLQERAGGSKTKGPPRKQKMRALLTAAAEQLEVLHEDSEMIIVNKPSGMIMHESPKTKTARTGTPTLAEILVAYTDGGLSRLGGEQARGVVHRIDKAVSGCVAFAKTDSAHAKLVRDFFRRDVKEKCYIALVASAPADSAGNITQEIDDLPALSSYRLLRSTENASASLVEVATSTGRKHQVRKHLRNISCPIFLDPLEPRFAQTRRGKKSSKKSGKGAGSSGNTALAEIPDAVAEAVGGKYARERIFLHAKRLRLRSPAGDVVGVEAPVPDWWLPVLAKLGLEL